MEIGNHLQKKYLQIHQVQSFDIRRNCKKSINLV